MLIRSLIVGLLAMACIHMWASADETFRPYAEELWTPHRVTRLRPIPEHPETFPRRCPSCAAPVMMEYDSLNNRTWYELDTMEIERSLYADTSVRTTLATLIERLTASLETIQSHGYGGIAHKIIELETEIVDILNHLPSDDINN